MKTITPKQAKHITVYLMETYMKSSTKFDGEYHEYHNVYILYLNNKTKRVLEEEMVNFQNQEYLWIRKTKHRSIKSMVKAYRADVETWGASLVSDYDIQVTKLGCVA